MADDGGVFQSVVLNKGRHILGHGRVVVSPVMGRVTVVPQVLAVWELHGQCPKKRTLDQKGEWWLTRAYTYLPKSRASALYRLQPLRDLRFVRSAGAKHTC